MVSDVLLLHIFALTLFALAWVTGTTVTILLLDVS